MSKIILEDVITELSDFSEKEMEKLSKAISEESLRRQGISKEEKEKMTEFFSRCMTGPRFVHLVEVYIKHSPSEEKGERIKLLQEKLQELSRTD